MLPVRLAEVQEKPVEWIWPGRIARGMLTLLEADPAMGKGFLAMDIAARLTRGLPMPGQIEDPKSKIENPCNVLLCTAEDSRSTTLKARARAAGADLDRIFCVSAPLLSGRFSGDAALLDMLSQLELTLSRCEIALMIFDPLVGFIQPLANAAERNARFVLSSITNIAERRNCGALGARHLTKFNRGPALYRGAGTIAFTAVARIVLTIGHGEDSRVLACVKNNISIYPPSLGFRIVPAGDSARVEWLGTVDVTADELAGQPRTVTPAIDRARKMLTSMLGEGSCPEHAIRASAAQLGISRSSLHRAKKTLGIRSIRQAGGRDAPWDWALPTPADPAPLARRKKYTT